MGIDFFSETEVTRRNNNNNTMSSELFVRNQIQRDNFCFAARSEMQHQLHFTK